MTKSIKTCEELSKNTTKAAKYLKLVTSEEHHEVIETITKIANIAINCSIDLCNKYFETSAGKEYLNMRKRIDRIGK